VLIFEFKHTPRQAQDWITEYNQDADIQIVYQNELKNCMYLVKVITKTESKDLETLIFTVPVGGKSRLCLSEFVPQGF
jgi:hypothetical protein